MGIETAIIGSALIGGGFSLFGASQQAEAAEAAASEQAKVAREQMALEKKFREQAIGFAAPTTKEWNMYNQRVAQYEKAYAMADGMLQQQKQQIEKTYGSAIIEQGNQLLASMKGQESAVEKTYSQSRQRDRARLEQQLIDRLGPGALTSSAGLQALGQFDQQTSDQQALMKDQLLTNAVNRLSGLQGTQSNAVSSFVNINGQLDSMSKGLQSTLDQFQVRRANAASGAASGTAQMTPFGVNTAGAQYVGQGIMGGAISNLGQSIGQNVSALGTAGFFNGRGGGGGGGFELPENMGALTPPSSLYGQGTLNGSQFGQPVGGQNMSLGNFDFNGT